jgi:4-aminobutyrate aminotransferase
MNCPQGAHGTTFGGNPVALAASLKTLQMLQGGLTDHAAKVGAAMIERLKPLMTASSIVGDVRGLGLMIGVEFVSNKSTGVVGNAKARDIVIDECFKRGLLMLSCGSHAIRFCPPLVLSEEQALHAVDIFIDAVKAVEGGQA